MRLSRLLQKKPVFTAFLALTVQIVIGQVQINGTVYDKSLQFAMRGVSVTGASGTGTMTDSLGHYHIKLSTDDSISFSYLGRSTMKFPVKDIPVGYPFDMSLEVIVDSLPTVMVRSRNYRQDSLENRREYKNIFDYGASYLTSTNTPRSGGVGVGLDLDMLFDGKKNRRMLAFQHRLEEEEKDKYVDHRFTRSIVRRITGLQSPAIDTFMRQYRPSYELIQSCATDYEFYKYILDWSKFFEKDWNTIHPPPPLQPYELSGYAQGTTWHITYFAADSAVTTEEIDSIMVNIDSSLSIYKAWSLISRFNRSDTGIEMDGHLRTVMEKSFAIHHETAGISDPTVYPLVNAWGFGPVKDTVEPDSQRIRNMLACVGADRLHIRGNTLVKDLPCIKLDLNGIAQGYTVDVVAGFLEKKDIMNYLVEVGGEIVLKGKRFPGGQPLSIGIEAPSDDLLDTAAIFKVIYPISGAVTTSGNYRKFRQSGGRTVSHLIDPHSGYPFSNNLLSVTVWAEDGITADGYDNALMGMGLAKAMDFMKVHPSMEAYFIYRDETGAIKSTFTPGFKKAMR
jgi:thiamine biosynthesis lipoprotein